MPGRPLAGFILKEYFQKYLLLFNILYKVYYIDFMWTYEEYNSTNVLL